MGSPVWIAPQDNAGEDGPISRQPSVMGMPKASRGEEMGPYEQGGQGWWGRESKLLMRLLNEIQ